jgi:hypothetical protein
MQTRKKRKTTTSNQRVQIGVKNVATLASSGNMKEQVHACVDVGETFVANVSRIEVEL